LTQIYRAECDRLERNASRIDRLVKMLDKGGYDPSGFEPWLEDTYLPQVFNSPRGGHRIPLGRGEAAANLLHQLERDGFKDPRRGNTLFTDIEEPPNLYPGWLLDFLVICDCQIHGIWQEWKDYQIQSIHRRDHNWVIPQRHFSPSPRGEQYLEFLLDLINRDWRADGSAYAVIEYLLDFLLWSLGEPIDRHRGWYDDLLQGLPYNPDRRLAYAFDPAWWLFYPYDYISALINRLENTLHYGPDYSERTAAFLKRLPATPILIDPYPTSADLLLNGTNRAGILLYGIHSENELRNKALRVAFYFHAPWAIFPTQHALDQMCPGRLDLSRVYSQTREIAREYYNQDERAFPWLFMPETGSIDWLVNEVLDDRDAPIYSMDPAYWHIPSESLPFSEEPPIIEPPKRRSPPSLEQPKRRVALPEPQRQVPTIPPPRHAPALEPPTPKPELTAPATQRQVPKIEPPRPAPRLQTPKRAPELKPPKKTPELPAPPPRNRLPEA